jgi:hypothetical protein
MRTIKIALFALLAVMTFSGCMVRYYLGMHGPSVKRYPDIHAGITRDQECLQCHRAQNNPQGPVTNHSHFTGCLKCHND